MIKCMFRLIESIKFLDGEFLNLFYHEQRMAHAMKTLYGITQKFPLEKRLAQYAPRQQGLFKCRIVYDDKAHEITFTTYTPKTIRRIKVVVDEEITYEFKYEDRQQIDRSFALRGECDDILIVKGGLVTDCSFSNIVFRKGKAWFTPASALLKGTMRQNLIDKNVIQVREIQNKDIPTFETFKLINAMLEFDGPEIVVSDIVF